MQDLVRGRMRGHDTIKNREEVVVGALERDTVLHQKSVRHSCLRGRLLGQHIGQEADRFDVDSSPAVVGNRDGLVALLPARRFGPVVGLGEGVHRGRSSLWWKMVGSRRGPSCDLEIYDRDVFSIERVGGDQVCVHLR